MQGEQSCGAESPNKCRSVVKVRSAGLTDPGRVRSRNEDNFAINPALNLFIVADGMGGHRCGDEASRRACLEIDDYLSANRHVIERCELEPDHISLKAMRRLLQDAIQAASERIVLEAEAHPDRQGMATTVVVALLAAGRAFIAHVGDSRAYLIREGRADLLTEDHSLFFELVRQGRLSLGGGFPYKNLVTRAVGVRGAAIADTLQIELWPRDRLLLCTDGLHSYLDEDLLAQLAAQGSPEEVVRRLVHFANDSGGADNITAVMVEVEEVSGDPEILRAKGRLLDSVPFFASLSLAEKLRLVSACDVKVLADGEVLFREGEHDDSLFIVLEGEIEVRRGEDVVASFGPGAELGEISLLEKHVRLATGVAKGKTEVLCFSRAAFEAITRRSPAFATRLLVNIARIVSARLWDANDELTVLKAHCADKGVLPPAVLPSKLLVEDLE